MFINDFMDYMDTKNVGNESFSFTTQKTVKLIHTLVVTLTKQNKP